MAYNKHDWVTGELITADKMNAIENGLDNANLIECDFKGRTKYLKGIDIDASTGIGTLKFYNGSDEKGNSEVKFFTLDSINSSIDGQSEFFTQAQGERYIDEKMNENYFGKNFPTALKDYTATTLESEENAKKYIVPKDLINSALATKLDKTSVAVVGENEEINWTEDKLVSAKDIAAKISSEIENTTSKKDTKLEESINTQFGTITKILNTIKELATPIQIWEGNKYVETDTIDLSDKDFKISDFDYLEFYIDHRTNNEKSMYIFQVPNTISQNGEVFVIRNTNIKNTTPQSPQQDTWGIEACEMYINIKDKLITITQNARVNWSGQSDQSADWTHVNIETPVSANLLDGIIKIKRIVGRKNYKALTNLSASETGGTSDDSNS